MKPTFATHNGYVTNNAVVDSPVAAAAQAMAHQGPVSLAAVDESSGSGLGGQIGELAAAINAVGWNHNQVPEGERLPPQERQVEPPHDPPGATAPSGLGGQIGELAAAINAVGWNHNQVPPDERLPPQER